MKSRQRMLVTPIQENGLRRDRFNNISSWKFVSREPKGTRVKSILLRGQSVFLFKEPNDHLEIAAEIFNSILANELGLNHVQYFPAKYNGKKGVVCASFLQYSTTIAELMEMKELLYRHSARLQKFSLAEYKQLRGRDPEAVKEHHIDNIFLVLDEECGSDPKVLKAFFRMIGFDALIGHTDRHWENYGLMLAYTKRRTVSLKLAPIYDTVTAYRIGERSDARIAKMLENEFKSPEWYRPSREDNCKIKIPENPLSNHFDLVCHIAKSTSMSVYRDDVFWAFDQFPKVHLEKLIDKFFRDLNPVRKKSFLEILNQRHRIGAELKKGV